MSIFDRAQKQKAARSSRKQAAGTAEAKAAVEAPSVNGEEPAPEVVLTGGAPWSNPSCKACKGRGLTSRGTACPICDNTAKKAGRLTSMAYIVETDDEGMGIAAAREEQVEALEAAGMALEWVEEAQPATAPESAPAASEPEEAPVVAEEPEAAPAEPEAQEEAPAPKPRRKRRTKAQIAADKAAEEAKAEEAEVNDYPDEPVVDARPTAQQAKPRKGAGRPRVGLTIMVGSTYLRGLATSREVISSSEVLARFGAELAEDMGAQSYWLLDTWKRRERLAEKSDYIVSQLAGVVVVHPGELGNDDIGTLMRNLASVSEGIEAVIARVG